MTERSAAQIAYLYLTQSAKSLRRLGLDPRLASRFKQHCQPWLKDVTCLGVGRKEVSGHAIDAGALVIGVRRKLKKPSNPIPPLLYLPQPQVTPVRPVLTDVIENDGRCDAMVGPGSTVTNLVNKPNVTGVVAALVVEQKAAKLNPMLLGCWHVFAGPNAQRGDQIATTRPKRANVAKLGRHANIQPGQNSQDPDYALARLVDGINFHAWPLLALAPRIHPPPAGDHFHVDQELRFYSVRRGRVVQLKVHQPNCSRSIRMFNSDTQFHRLVWAKPPDQEGSLRGDSGSPVVDSSGALVGYVIAGAEELGDTYIQPLRPILDSLGLKLVLANLEILAHGAVAARTLPLAGYKDGLDTLARTIWGEARGESQQGRLAVAWVVMNRVNDAQKRWPRTIEEVCRQPKQFSCWNAKDRNLPKLLAVTGADPVFRECLQLAKLAVRNELPPDPTQGANHHHRDDVSPRWAAKMTKTRHIGRHVFLRN